MQLFHLVDCDPELDSRGQSDASFSCFWVFPSNSQFKVLNGSTQHFLKNKTEDNLTSVIYLLEVFSEAMIFHSCLGLCTVAFGGERHPVELLLIGLWPFSRGGFFCKIKRQLQKPSHRPHLVCLLPELFHNTEETPSIPHLCATVTAHLHLTQTSTSQLTQLNGIHPSPLNETTTATQIAWSEKAPSKQLKKQESENLNGKKKGKAP